MALEVSPFLAQPLRPFADYAAEKYGCLRRFYYSYRDREGEDCCCSEWSKDAAAAERTARDRLKGTGCEFTAVDPTWDAVRFPDDKIMQRSEFEAWAHAMAGRDVQQMIGGQVGRAA